MRISRLFMDGFGIFRDVDVGGLQPGLSLFLGDNEAGKSTTLGFIYTVLFGYPDGRSKEKVHVPLRGGRAGGRIEFETNQDGRLTVERRPGKKGGPITVRFSHGHADADGELSRLLGGTTGPLYRNLYAFSLTELQDLKTLTDEDVKDVIYGASLGASARRLPEARKHLEARMAELFRPSGSKPEINTYLKDLEGVRIKLREARQGIKEYEELAGTLAGLDQRVHDLKNQLTRQRHTVEQLKARVKLWDDWVELREAEEQLAHLPEVVESFPDQGLGRLDELTGKRETQKEELRCSQEEIEQERQKLEQLLFDANLLAREADLQVLTRGLNMYEKAVAEIPRAADSLKAAQQRSRSILAQFGAGWTEDRVLGLDRSPMMQQRIIAHGTALQEARRRLEKVSDDVDRLTKDLEEAAREETAAREEVRQLKYTPMEGDPETLAALLDHRKEFQSVIQDLPEVEAEHREELAGLEDRLREINPDWTPEILQEFDGSFTSLQKVNQMESHLRKAAAEVQETGRRLEQASTALHEHEQGIVRQAQEIREAGSDTPTLEVLRQRKALIRSLREATSRRRVTEAATEARRQMVPLQVAQPAVGLTGALRRRPRIAAALALLSALAGGAALWFNHDSLAGGIVSAVLLLVAVTFFLLGRSADGAAEPETAHISPGDIGALGPLETRLEAIASEILDLQGQLAVSGEMNPAAIDSLEDETDLQIEAARHLSRLRSHLSKLQAGRDRAAQQRKDAAAGVDRSQEQLKEAQGHCMALAVSLRLSPETSPGTVRVVFGMVEGARDRVRGIKKSAARLKKMRAARNSYLDLMKKVPRLSAAASGSAQESLAALGEFFSDQEREAAQEKRLAAARFTAGKALQKLTAAQEKLKMATRRQRDSIDVQERTRQAWTTWLREQQMDETWAPDVCSRLLQRAMDLADQADKQAEIKGQMEQLATEKSVFSRRVAALSAQLHRQVPPEDKLTAEVHALETLLADHLQKRTLHQSVARSIQDLTSRSEQRQQHIQQLEADIQKLVAAGHARNEAEFRARGRIHAQGQDLLKKIALHTSNMKKISGERDPANLRAALLQATLPGIEVAMAEAQETVQNTETSLAGSQQEYTRADEKRKRLHDENAMAQLHAAEERLLEKLRVTTDDWARHAVAQHLLSTAKERFEKTHQPEVIRLASGYFSSITGGRYGQIFAPHDGRDAIQVVDSDGSHKPVEALSRGTAEQLYLAIRFGYIASHGHRGERLPILMDDVLVNFDPTRAALAARGILEMAQSHQVLFFTCHPEMVAIFQSHRKDVPVYRIAGHDIREPVAPSPPAGRTPRRRPPMPPPPRIKPL